MPRTAGYVQGHAITGHSNKLARADSPRADDYSGSCEDKASKEEYSVPAQLV